MDYEYYDCKHCAYGTASRELMVAHAAMHREPAPKPQARTLTPGVYVRAGRHYGLVSRPGSYPWHLQSVMGPDAGTWAQWVPVRKVLGFWVRAPGELIWAAPDDFVAVGGRIIKSPLDWPERDLMGLVLGLVCLGFAYATATELYFQDLPKHLTTVLFGTGGLFVLGMTALMPAAAGDY